MSETVGTVVYVDRSRTGRTWAVWTNTFHYRDGKAIGRTVGRSDARYYERLHRAVDAAADMAAARGGTVNLHSRAKRALEDEGVAS